ncbi:MAG: heavy metal sensor histidine kinase [Acidobacteria bacterium]|nr:heavy metal sensor histidine kinase [Acidobacteriota bacterium]
MLDSVRTRLTLWYVGVLALVLLGFSLGVYALLARNLHQRLEAGLRGTTEAIAAMIERERAEGESAAEAAKSAIEELHYPQQGLAVYDGRRQLLVAKPAGSGVEAPSPPENLTPSSQITYQTIPATQKNDEDGIRVAWQRVSLTAARNEYWIVVAQPLESIAEELEQLREIFYLAVPLALLVAGLGGWWLARQSLASVVAMSEQARRIGAENLGQRLLVANPRDELGQLAATFNELLGRLHNAFDQQRQFMADASHELRTPLYVIRTATAVTLEQPQRAETEYREALAIVEAQTQRLTRIVEDMFILARADAGQRELQVTDFYLDELLAATVLAARVLAERKGVGLELQAAESLYRGDEGLLRQMLLNLLDNAIKHTPAGGAVMVHLLTTQTACEITVTDTGAGIPAAAQSHIFERFYRVDKARSRSENGKGSGAGLGLAIARWIAEAHHGTLRLKRSDASGSVFVVALPAFSLTPKNS